MGKGIKWIIGIVTSALLCSGCFLIGKSATNELSLIVEDGMVKYNNGGKWEEVLPLEALFTSEDNTTVVKSKDVEFSVQDGYIVWNYVGETNVTKLIAVEDLVGEQGVTGKDGQNGQDGVDGKSMYIWIKYLDKNPESYINTNNNNIINKSLTNVSLTNESVINNYIKKESVINNYIKNEYLKDEVSNYMGIYYGESSTAPTDISSYKWFLVKGEKGEAGEDGTDGKNAYVWIKYLDQAPEVSTASDMKDDGGNFIGVYSGESSVAPASVASYTWSEIKGKKGEKGNTGANGADGADGKNAYVWIKYLDQAPEASTASDMKDNGGSYMGVYSGESSVAPASIASYTWSVIKETQTSTGSTTTDPIIAGGIDINGSISVDDPIINNNNNNSGIISEIAIYEGEITRSITGDTQLLLPEGFTYNSGDSITFDDIAKKAVLRSGCKYMITISGNAVFQGTDSYLYININQRSFAYKVLWKSSTGSKLHL